MVVVHLPYRPGCFTHDRTLTGEGGNRKSEKAPCHEKSRGICTARGRAIGRSAREQLVQEGVVRAELVRVDAQPGNGGGEFYTRQVSPGHDHNRVDLQVRPGHSSWSLATSS